eukprot:161282_1
MLGMEHAEGGAGLDVDGPGGHGQHVLHLGDLTNTGTGDLDGVVVGDTVDQQLEPLDVQVQLGVVLQRHTHTVEVVVEHGVANLEEALNGQGLEEVANRLADGGAQVVGQTLEPREEGLNEG